MTAADVGGKTIAIQIIRLYEYFEKKPEGLLLMPATTGRQQEVFEDLYA